MPSGPSRQKEPTARPTAPNHKHRNKHNQIIVNTIVLALLADHVTNTRQSVMHQTNSLPATNLTDTNITEKPTAIRDSYRHYFQHVSGTATKQA